MDKLVKQVSYLKWDGWTVIVEDDSDGYYAKDGIFTDGKWKRQYRFEMFEYGSWNIPDRYLTNV